MRKELTISVFEHERLTTDHPKFEQHHLDAMWRLNEYHDQQFFVPIARGVQFSQYVGIIQIDGLTIEIHPKSDRGDANENWRGVLLQMLKTCGKLKAQTAGEASVKRQNLNLLEVYFELYLNEVKNLVRRGLVKQYRKETANVKALKGKLEFAGNIRRNLVHKERFYTTHQVYDTDHHLHHVLFCALDIVEEFTRGTRLYDLSKRVLLNFPKAENKRITKQQLDSIVLSRKTAPYEYALELARLIILNYSPDISSGREKMISLLFDMNQLWEEFIYKQLREHVAENHSGYVVGGQESKPFWRSNTLRPDIVIQGPDRSTFIIDTKWKRPYNSSASVQDLRQMYAYNQFWNADRAMLLYPGNASDNSFEPFQNKFEQSNTKCKVGFVNVLNEENKLDDRIGERVWNLMELD